MLHSIKKMQGYTVLAEDGEIGRVADFYFDDDSWVIQYLVVDTGNWLQNRKRLLSPLVLKQPDWESARFPVSLTQAEVENSPDIETEKPISRQQQIQLHNYYMWPMYWSVPGGVYYVGMPPEAIPILAEDEEAESAESHLRSADELQGYLLQARDGDIGHVEDFIVDDESWSINYMVVDTCTWLPGRQVLIAPAWIETVDWASARVQVDLLRETVRNSPRYDPSQPIEDEYQAQLHKYYNIT